MKKLFLLLLAIASFMTHGSSAELIAKPAIPENRFLFVVETSFAMSRSAKAAQDTVRELIESGMQGQMQPGDTFGLWTFNEQLNAEFPMQRWTPGDEKKLAQLADDFLKKRRYEKKAKLSVALPPLNSVIKSSKAITVILISTGSEPIQGTPFDKVINTIYPSYVRELREAKLAFVTILVGRNGRLVDYAVNSSLGPIQIPHPPIEPEKIASPPKTNAVAAKKQVSKTPTNQVPTPKPAEKKIDTDVVKATPSAIQQVTVTATAVARVVPKPAIETNEVVANNSTNISTPISAPKVELSTPLVQTNTIDLLVPSKSEPLKVGSESSVVTTVGAPTALSTTVKSEQKIETNNPVNKTAVTNSAPAIVANKTSNDALLDPPTEETASYNSTLPDFKPLRAEMISPKQESQPSRVSNGSAKPAAIPVAELKAVAQQNEPAPPLPVPPPVVAVQPVFTPQKLLAVGATLLAVAGILVWLMVRHSRKSQPSLISRSIDRSK